MTRVQTATSDTVTLTGADYAEAIDQFIRRCHQDLATGLTTGLRAYTLVNPGGPVAHFDVRCAVTGSLPSTLLAGASKGGVTLNAGDRVLIVTAAGSSGGVWVVQTTAIDAVRATDCDILAEITGTLYVRVTAGTDAGRWYLLDSAGIGNINLASYTIVGQ